jgi:LuxR family transcriptional regulator
MNAWREDCLNRLNASAGSASGVLRELSVIVNDLGFEYCSYVLRTALPVPNPAVTWATTYPQSWVDHYFRNQYLEIDPVLEQISKNPLPVVWTDPLMASKPDFWEDARAYGIRHGWGLATYGKGAMVGMLSLARSHDSVTDRELADTEMRLVWLSHLVQGLIVGIEMQNLALQGDVELTHREREVLRWSAAGKTAEEIGFILGISVRTVTFHVTSSLSKLNVINKTQAVATALLLGML